MAEPLPIDVRLMTHVLIAPILTLVMWRHSIGPCDRADLDPQAFLDAFLDMALHGLLPKEAPATAPAQ